MLHENDVKIEPTEIFVDDSDTSNRDLQVEENSALNLKPIEMLKNPNDSSSDGQKIDKNQTLTSEKDHYLSNHQIQGNTALKLKPIEMLKNPYNSNSVGQKSDKNQDLIPEVIDFKENLAERIQPFELPKVLQDSSSEVPKNESDKNLPSVLFPKVKNTEELSEIPSKDHTYTMNRGTQVVALKDIIISFFL